MASKTPQILELDPSNELVFQGPFTEVVTTSLKLGNPTNERVGFNVKTTAPKQYCVRPNNGIISPHGEQVVSVMLQPMEDVSPVERAKHKFMVQSMCVDDTITSDNLVQAMRQADRKKLTDSKLICSFIEGSSDQVESKPHPQDQDSSQTNVTSDQRMLLSLLTKFVVEDNH